MDYYKVALVVIAVVIGSLVVVNLLLYFFPNTFLPLPNHQPFKSVWSAKDKDEMIQLLKESLRITSSHDIEMIAVFGTLLGVARHAGVIPWDDDLDFVISKKRWNELLSLKNKFAKVNLGIIQYSSTLIKIYNLNKSLIPGTSWSWPFIDVFNYRLQGEYVVIDNEGPQGCFSGICTMLKPDDDKILSTDFFPLRTNLFEGIPVNIPNNVDKVLEDKYGKDWETICVSSGYNHRKEKVMRGGKRVACKSVISKVNDNIFNNVWVVNLDRRPDRWKQTNQRLNNLGITAQRWSATDKESPSFISVYNNTNTSKSPGEVACYNSHLKLWKHIYDMEVPHAIIFEDDISIPPTLTLKKVKEAIDDSVGFNILLLGYCGPPLLHTPPKTTSRVGTAQCSHSYAVSRAGLKSLLSGNHNFNQAVDEFIYDFCRNNLCYYARHLPDPKEKLFGKGLFHQDERNGSDIRKID